MQAGMETAKRVLISHAGPEAFAPMTRVILAKLGYLVLMPEEAASIRDLADARPLVRLLDERQMAEIPDDGDGIPIILLTGRHGATGADPRIAGAVKRPAGMHEEDLDPSGSSPVQQHARARFGGHRQSGWRWDQPCMAGDAMREHTDELRACHAPNGPRPPPRLTPARAGG